MTEADARHMPQTLKSRFPSGDVAWYLSPAATDNRPTLAAKAMRLINMWSHADALFASIVVERFATNDFRLVTAMLNTLTGTDARRAAMLAAAEESLGSDSDRFKYFAAVDLAVRKYRNRRNLYAHGLWGYSDQLPDALLLIDSRHVHAALARIAHNKEILFRWEDLNRELPGTPPPPLELMEGIDIAHVWVYEGRDLDADIAKAQEVSTWVSLLHSEFAGGLSHVAPPHPLLRAPQVKKAWDRLNRTDSPPPHP